jgi:hypothetical protein
MSCFSIPAHIMHSNVDRRKGLGEKGDRGEKNISG